MSINKRAFWAAWGLTDSRGLLLSSKELQDIVLEIIIGLMKKEMETIYFEALENLSQECEHGGADTTSILFAIHQACCRLLNK